MGCGKSKVARFRVNASVKGQSSEALDEMLALGVTRGDVDKFYASFLQVGNSGRGEIELDAFFRAFRLDDTPFARRVFGLLDLDHSGLIDFREFVISVVVYCSLSETSLIKFAFGVYDGDQSRHLDPSEVRGLVTEVYGDEIHSIPRVLRLLEAFDVDGDGLVSRDEFTHMVHRYPLLLWPAFKLQQTIRQEVVGETYWEKRSEEDGGQRVLIDILLDPKQRETLMRKAIASMESVRAFAVESLTKLPLPTASLRGIHTGPAVTGGGVRRRYGPPPVRAVSQAPGGQ